MDRDDSVRSPLLYRSARAACLPHGLAGRTIIARLIVLPTGLSYNVTGRFTVVVAQCTVYRTHPMMHKFSPQAALLHSLLVVQEFSELCARTLANLFRRPFYVQETLLQMDRIGVGSLFIVVLTGLFTGMVLALQGAVQLEPYGATIYVSRLISTSVVRELGPVLAALMIAGRVGTGIASELASMTVTEQIDALRAEGTDPVHKLATTRLVACMIMIPLLTIVADGIAVLGGWLVARLYLGIDSYFYWTWAFEAIHQRDLVLGLFKPLVFGTLIAMVGCYAGFSTRGGTVGVGTSTTQSMVSASILILASDFFITKLFMAIP